MRRLVAACLFGTFLILNQGILAYEIDTHEKLSEAATSRSVLKTDSVILHGLGLQFSIEDDRQQFPGSDGKPKNILNLIKAGSRFEDDDKRPINHFFDPLRNQPLRLFGLIPLPNETSPDWALEDTKNLGEQAFSFKHARDYLHKALTLTDPREREKHFGLTFQTLGHIIHHVQDMAQPQHVRNDAHLDRPKEFFGIIPNPLYNPSLYEEHTKKLGGNLSFGGYPKVTFTKPRDFWITGGGAGQGLAEYTNRGFVSAGTNFDDKSGRYASPALDPNSAWEADIRRPDLFPAANMPIPSQCQDDANPCYMTFYRNTVVDSYRPTETKVNDKTSTWSIFDQDLKTYNTTFTRTDPDTGQTYTTNQAFSLNRFNFDEAHKFLIPRAVAYSTGLLDYFFRGKLEAQDAGFTDTGISLRVKNAIDPKAMPAWKGETMPRSHA